jgi:hypothetical protein
MKHKLNRAKPKTMAEFMAIADKYASADSVARVKFGKVGPAAGQPSRHPARAGIKIVTVMARGKMSAMTTSMARSRWP